MTDDRTRKSLRNFKSKFPENLTLKERMTLLNPDPNQFRGLVNNTEIKRTPQEQLDFNAHPDREVERKQQAEDERRERDRRQNELGFGSGSAGRVDMLMSQGLSEDDATFQAFEDNNIDTSEMRRQASKPEHERQAKHGFMGMVNHKTLFTVGEQNKREFVSVKPKNDFDFFSSPKKAKKGKKNNNIFDVGGF